MRLNIEVFADRSCSFRTFDWTAYHETEVTDVIKHVFLEFMVYLPYDYEESSIIALKNSKKVTTFTDNSVLTPLEREYRYTIRKDGTYVYYKYGLYTIEHESIWDGTTYNILNKVFYHNGTVYLGTANTTEPIFDSSNSVIISNWYRLKDYMATSIDFYYDQQLFTICNLEACLHALQKKLLIDGLKDCSFGSCQKDKQLKAQVEFLFISVFVLNYLMNIGNYLEAQRLLERLATCGSLCSDSLLTNNNCNCGSTV